MSTTQDTRQNCREITTYPLLGSAFCLPSDTETVTAVDAYERNLLCGRRMPTGTFIGDGQAVLSLADGFILANYTRHNELNYGTKVNE
jgi:hypothetical protein